MTGNGLLREHEHGGVVVSQLATILVREPFLLGVASLRFDIAEPGLEFLPGELHVPNFQNYFVGCRSCFLCGFGG
jgi:hypothetical protein